jgi:hypothetical protein
MLMNLLYSFENSIYHRVACQSHCYEILVDAILGLSFLVFVARHYRKDGLCRAPNDLLGAFYRAHGKGLSLPCAYDTTHGSDKRTVQTSLPCVVSRAQCVGP